MALAAVIELLHEILEKEGLEKKYNHALNDALASIMPDSGPTDAPGPSKAPEPSMEQDSQKSTTPPQSVAQVTQPVAQTSWRDAIPSKPKPKSQASEPKSWRDPPSTKAYRDYKERIATLHKSMAKSKSKTKSNIWADDDDSPLEEGATLSTDEEWEAVANQNESGAEDPTDQDMPGKSDDYDTVSTSDGEDSIVCSGGKRRKRKSPSHATKAKKAVKQSSPQPIPPVASPTRQPSSTPAATAASQRTSRPPSPMVVTTDTTKKPPPPPPIYLQDKGKWNDVSAACVERKINYTKATACQNGIKIQVPTPRDFRDLTRHLKENKFSFHTYALPEEKSLRVVMRRIPKEIPTEEIRKDLLAQKVPVTEVHRLHKAKGGLVYDMVMVTCSPTEGRNPIFNIKTVCSLSGITVEKPYRPHLVGQCHNCQMYGHSQTNCYATPRCVKCLGEHNTKDCPRPKNRADCTEPPSCVLCGQIGHPANYRGCPKAPKLAPKTAKRFNRQQAPSAPLSQPPRLAPQRTSPWGKLNHQRVAPQSYSQPMPALLDQPIAAPIPLPITTPGPVATAAPKTAQSRKVAPTTTSAKCPPPVALSGHKPYLSVAENIISAYSIWMTPQARALDAEIRNAGPLTPTSCSAIFSRYECITRELDRLIYKDGQWVRN